MKAVLLRLLRRRSVIKRPLEERRERARKRCRYERVGSRWLLGLAAVVLFIGLPLGVWKGPYLLDEQYLDTGSIGEGAGSAALVTGLRTAMVTCVASIGAGIALFYTARNYRLNHRGQVTERFTNALERLDSERIYVRVGGILALEQIVRDAPEQTTDADSVLQHFVRDMRPPTSLDPPDADIQAALTALTRAENRTYSDAELDLRHLRLPRASLVGADLTEACLEGVNLTEAKLVGADLTNAWLEGADLTEAELAKADLTEAELAKADLTNAWLEGADLTEAKLAKANLTRARLEGANLTRAELARANLTEAKLVGADLTNARLEGADLTNARLEGADFSGARLVGADLSGADLAEADFSGARLEGANLTEAKLVGADLTEADLAKADLTEAKLAKANLTRARLEGANLTRAELARANLTGARLVGVHITLARLGEQNRTNTTFIRTQFGVITCRTPVEPNRTKPSVDFTGAKLEGADLTNARLEGADFSGARLAGADFTSTDVTAEQVLGARSLVDIHLPPDVGQDPEVVARLNEESGTRPGSRAQPKK